MEDSCNKGSATDPLHHDKNIHTRYAIVMMSGDNSIEQI